MNLWVNFGEASHTVVALQEKSNWRTDLTVKRRVGVNAHGSFAALFVPDNGGVITSTSCGKSSLNKTLTCGWPS